MSVEWYQKEATVTASVSMKGLSPNESITANFRERYCAVLAGGIYVIRMCGSLNPRGIRRSMMSSNHKAEVWPEYSI